MVPIIVKNKHLKLKLINYLLDKVLKRKLYSMLIAIKFLEIKSKLLQTITKIELFAFRHPKINQNYIAFITII